MDGSGTCPLTLAPPPIRLAHPSIRMTNKSWLRYSQLIAMMMLDRMEELHMSQKQLSELMGCSQQYVSKVLKGQENLSLETLYKIEQCLNLQIIAEPELV